MTGQVRSCVLENTQVLIDEETPDMISSALYADPGIEITVSPGIVDGSLWQGVIRGSGFDPGENRWWRRVRCNL